MAIPTDNKDSLRILPTVKLQLAPMRKMISQLLLICAMSVVTIGCKVKGSASSVNRPIIPIFFFMDIPIHQPIMIVKKSAI